MVERTTDNRLTEVRFLTGTPTILLLEQAEQDAKVTHSLVSEKRSRFREPGAYPLAAFCASRVWPHRLWIDYCPFKAGKRV
jgi:hypothetical protein